MRSQFPQAKYKNGLGVGRGVLEANHPMTSVRHGRRWTLIHLLVRKLEEATERPPP